MSSTLYAFNSSGRAATQQSDVRFLSMPGQGREPQLSPLHLFGQAKKKITLIVKDLSKYIKEGNDFLSKLEADYPKIAEKCQNKNLLDTKSIIDGIERVISRDRMKVVFFGRTSNGKSTVINAMLKDKILPSGIGHTTHCFVQVEGTEAESACLMLEGNPQPQALQSVSELVHALSEYRLEENSLIRILWPKQQCALLREDVVFVDSPGIDVSPNLDQWIDKFCLDADVFVLVANAESTLMQTEKNFFHKVNKRLSKPNVFILNNRWDASAGDDAASRVREQHMSRNTEFLRDELHVLGAKADARDRVYFVSAKEVLVSRVNTSRGTPTPDSVLCEGHQARAFEFSRFEEEFQKCISYSAVQTKFATHTQRALRVTAEVRSLMDSLLQDVASESQVSAAKKQELLDKVDHIEKRLLSLTQEVKDKINAMTEEVEMKVSHALVDEIRRLSVLVDEFERPFHPDSHVLQHYKKELHAYVEQGLGRNLQAKCSTTLRLALEETTKDMKEGLVELLPEGASDTITNALPRADFEVAYRLDCRNLCADFQEDVDFHFSLGLRSIAQRFLGHRGMSVLLGSKAQVPRPMPPSTPQTPSNAQRSAPHEAGDNVALLAALATTAHGLGSTYTVAALAGAGLLTRAIGWRVLAVGVGMYGALYVYERLRFTRASRERLFKQQYVQYASSRLKLIVDLTSASCSHQVQQELSSTFARMCREVDVHKQQLLNEATELQQRARLLADTAITAKSLRNRAQYLDTELTGFKKQFLSDDS